MVENDTRNRRSVLKVIGATGGAISLAGCTGGGGSSDAFTLGTLAPQSGGFSASGPSVVQGDELAVKHINEDGGVNGEDVEMIVRDTETDPNAGVRAARELIRQENVDALSGAVSSSVGMAIASMANQEEIPYIGGIGSAAIVNADCGPYVYTNNPSTYIVAQGTIPYLINEQGSQSIYCITADYTWGQTIQKTYEEIIPANGGEIAGTSFAPFGANDFSSQISKAIDSGADTLMMTLWGQDQVKCVNQMLQFGAREEFENIAMAWNSIALNKSMDSVEGIYAGGPYYWGIESDQNQTFVESYESEYNEKPPMASGMQYGSTTTLLNAANDADSISADDVATSLEGWTNDPYYKGGNQEFRPCDHQNVSDWFVLQGTAESERSADAEYMKVIQRRAGGEVVQDCSSACEALPAWS
ncbi:ABC transporter substrate-binding protein [Natrinema caseinilyticum]|uniref:ABC transporter substrate-binding protein n=1 Tax=Natrinema caseinilyticum TaxID=2961570 RepID=UPI0020C4FCC7|nr:ABC transporter substrate-binding protein [Natrinema caseinilyticum]